MKLFEPLRAHTRVGLVMLLSVVVIIGLCGAREVGDSLIRQRFELA